MRFLLSFGLILLLAGCQTRLDTATPASTRASVEAMKADLPADERPHLEEALTVFLRAALTDSTMQALMVQPDPDVVLQRALNDLDGWSAEEIIAEGRRLRRVQELAEREKGMAALQALRARVEAGETLDMIDEARLAHLETLYGNEVR